MRECNIRRLCLAFIACVQAAFKLQVKVCSRGCGKTNRYTYISYSMVVLHRGINKVWGFLPKNPNKKSAKYLFSDSMAALVRHSQAQKYLQINSKPLH